MSPRRSPRIRNQSSRQKGAGAGLSTPPPPAPKKKAPQPAIPTPLSAIQMSRRLEAVAADFFQYLSGYKGEDAEHLYDFAENMKQIAEGIKASASGKTKGETKCDSSTCESIGGGGDDDDASVLSSLPSPTSSERMFDFADDVSIAGEQEREDGSDDSSSIASLDSSSTSSDDFSSATKPASSPSKSPGAASSSHTGSHSNCNDASETSNASATRPRSSPIPSREPSFNREEAKENNVPNYNEGPTNGLKSPPTAHTPMKTNSPAAKPKPKYTYDDQVEYASKVIRAKESGKGSYYQVLEISTEASANDVKRAYKEKVVKVHPDHCRAPNATEAFRAVKEAYDTLKSPSKREAYDRNNDVRSVPRSTEPSPQYVPGSSQYNTMRAGTRVRVHDLDSRMNGLKGYVVSCSRAGEYQISFDSCEIDYFDPSALFQNATVQLRDSFWLKRFSGIDEVFLENPLMYQNDLYEATWECDGEQESGLICSEEFIIPNRTIVRLEGLKMARYKRYNGSYGRVASWTERFERNGEDTSYYEVEMSSSVTLGVKMRNVRL